MNTLTNLLIRIEALTRLKAYTTRKETKDLCSSLILRLYEYIYAKKYSPEFIAVQEADKLLKKHAATLPLQNNSQ